MFLVNLDPSLEFVGVSMISLVLFMLCLLCVVGCWLVGCFFLLAVDTLLNKPDLSVLLISVSLLSIPFLI